MAQITKDDVLKLARLAQLQLSDEEVSHFSEELSEILGYVEKLSTIDLSTYKPTYQVTGLENVTRPDKVKQYTASPDDLLKNAPQREGRQFKVKRMIG